MSPDSGIADAADITDVRAVADASDAPSPIDAPDDSVAVDVAPADVAPVDACSGGTSVTSCGPRCERCASPANAEPTCDGTRCGFTCNTGFGDCDARTDNGCEAPLDSLDHCGACGTRCAAPMNAAPSCSTGRCEWRCDVGFERVMDRCERIRVRPILPQSTTYTASEFITFEWANPGGVDEYEVVLGQTRSAIATASGTRVRGATSLRWPTALTNDNTWFWQVRAYAMGAEVSRSATWAFRPTLRRAQPPLRENLLRLIVDVDCDGEEDIAIPDGDSEATWGVYFYNHTDIARGSYARSSRFILFPMSRLVTVTALGDVDGNGCTDLSANGDVLFGNEGTLPTRITTSMGASPLYVHWNATVGDLDRDGYADVFAVPTSTPTATHIAFGTRSRALRDILPVTASGIVEPRIGRHAIDRDLDGVFDVAITDLMTSTSRGYYRWDGSTNAFVRTGPFTAVDGEPVGDISCDGYIDYVARYGDVWLSTPSIPETSLGRFQHAPMYPSPRGFVELGDINSDAGRAHQKFDVAARRSVVAHSESHVDASSSLASFDVAIRDSRKS